MIALTPEIVRARVADGSLTLCRGNGSKGTCCVMQAVSLYLGRTGLSYDFSQPILSIFLRQLNDRMTDDERRALVPYVKRIAESPVETDAIRRKRAQILVDDALHVQAPAALELAALESPECAVILREHAEILRRLESGATEARDAYITINHYLTASAATSHCISAVYYAAQHISATAATAVAYGTAAYDAAGAFNHPYWLATLDRLLEVTA